jgi:HEAT repeat protein
MTDWSRHRSRWAWLLAVGLLLAAAVVIQTQYRDWRVGGRTGAQWSLRLMSSPQDREVAEAALKQLGQRAIPSLCRALRSRDSRFVPFLLRVARHCPAPVRDRITTSLYPNAATKRALAAQALAVLGPDAATAIPELETALHDQDFRPAYQIAAALGRLGPTGRQLLLADAQSSDATVRQVATYGLSVAAALAAETPDAATLLRALRDPDPAARNAASNAIARSWAMTTTGLVAAVEFSRGPVRESAAKALIEFRIQSPRAQPALLDMLREEGAPGRRQAVETLAYLQPWTPAVFAALVAALQDPSPAVRLAATNALGPGNSRARISRQLLTESLAQTNPCLREWSARTLGYLGSNAAAAVPALQSLASDTNAAVRAAAAEALTRIRAAAP